jgi:membrane AbrB-like protein
MGRLQTLSVTQQQCKGHVSTALVIEHHVKLPLTIVVGLFGALAFALLQLPIPWLLGSLCSCAVAVRLSLPLAAIPDVPERLMRVAIGVSLGPAVAASINNNAGDLPFAVPAAVIVTMATALAGMRWFQARADLSRAAAFLSAVPGGLSVFFGLSNKVGERAQILLAHTIRVVIVVVFISLLARTLGIAVEDTSLLTSLDWRSEASPLVLLALVAVNFLVAEKLKIAGGHVIIPMLTTAAIAVTTDVPVESPRIVQSVAMLVFGAVLGRQLASSPAGENSRVALAATGFSVLAIAFVAFIAQMLSMVSASGFLVLFLALAPGGIAEVSLIAAALGLDAGLVALLHSCRFLFIVALGPLVFAWINRDS